MYPEELKYTSEHEWVLAPGESDGSVRIGITHYAQDALGDIVYVSLPEVGETVAGGSTCGELESTKSVSDVYAPVSGEVVAVNDALTNTPELVNNDPVRRRLAVRGGPVGRGGRRRPDGRRDVPRLARELTGRARTL